MGTHPIFESDFDCLTDKIKKKMILSGQLRRSLINVTIKNNAKVITLNDPSRHHALSLDMLKVYRGLLI